MSEITLVPDTSMRLDVDIKRSLQRDIKECHWSREQIALRLSLHAGRTVTVAQINAYTAETKPHRFPLELLPAWIAATGSRRLLDVIVPLSGPYVIADESDQKLANYARALLERDAVATRLDNLRADLLKPRKLK